MEELQQFQESCVEGNIEKVSFNPHIMMLLPLIGLRCDNYLEINSSI